MGVALKYSTPFGITAVGTLAGLPVLDGPPCVLNAFRHHRGRPRRGGGRPNLGQPVLNAFRHHGGRHSAPQPRTPERGTCSTPFGITEVGTRWSASRAQSTTSSAQRLSASQRSAPVV